MGTSVQSGTATAVVVVTGVRTYLAQWRAVSRRKKRQRALDQGLSRFTWLMIQLMAVMVAPGFLINGLPSTIGKGTFFFAMAVA